jgi:hypothetical protein
MLLRKVVFCCIDALLEPNVSIQRTRRKHGIAARALRGGAPLISYAKAQPHEQPRVDTQMAASLVRVPDLWPSLICVGDKDDGGAKCPEALVAILVRPMP